MILKGKVLWISLPGDPLNKYGELYGDEQTLYVREMTRAFDSMGVGVDIFTVRQNPKQVKIQPLGKRSRIIRIQLEGDVTPEHIFESMPLFISQVKSYIHTPGQYSIIHTNGWLSGFAGRSLKKAYAVPLVHTLGWSNSQPNKNSDRGNIEKQVIKETDLLTLPNRSKTAVINEYGIPSERVKHFECGISPIFKPLPSSIRKKTDIYKIFVGAQGAEPKKLRVFLRRLQELTQDTQLGERLHITIMGMQPNSLQLPPSIRGLKFADPLRDEELAIELARSDLTVLLSRNASLGLMAINALGCGSPVIGFRTGGNLDNVIERKTGSLVDIDDYLGLADKVNMFLKDPQLMSSNSRNAVLQVQGKSWLKTAFKVVKGYTELTNAPSIFAEPSLQSSWGS